jgi:alkylated DNA repair protein (DNA oxidative demethylase)
MGTMRGERQVPEGLRYVDDFLSEAEESALIAEADRIDYRTFELRGQVARRTVRTFGYSYDFDARSVTQIEPLPDWLLALRNRCGELAEVEPTSFVHALVNRYPPGATIGWHRDAPAFGDVVGVSLASPCAMRFQRGTGTERRVFEQPLEPRSGYVLTGPSRTSWQHSIPAVRDERFSITFRTLRRAFG